MIFLIILNIESHKVFHDPSFFPNSKESPSFTLMQKIDHFNPIDLRTFAQRYFINDTNYIKGGPVFLQLGGEGPWGDWYMSEGLSPDLSVEYGALLVGLEHRYYGNSQPFSKMSLDNLKYLNSHQAIADVMNLYSEIKNKYPDSGKWISFGCSYSGCLSLWLRMKYPHLISGAYSGSSPVWANTHYIEYDQTCEDSLGPKCLKDMIEAFKPIKEKLFTADGLKELSIAFNTCKTIESEWDIKMFKWSVINRIQGAVQYNNANKGFPRIQMCKDLLESENKFIEYAKQSRIDNGGCLDLSLDSMIDETAGPQAAGRAWYWQKATEFGYFKNSPEDSDIFFSSVNEKFHKEIVEMIFGESLFPNVKWTSDSFGGQHLTSQMLSNAIITNGEWDPWSRLSILSSISNNVTSVIYTSSGHCAPVYPIIKDGPNKTPDDVLFARKQVADFIRNTLQN